MFKKGAIIADTERRIIYKILEIDEPMQDYILSVVYPRPLKSDILRKDMYRADSALKLVFE